MKTNFYRGLGLLLSAFILTACEKKAEPVITQISETSSDHLWYAFTRTGIEVCGLPQKSSIQSLLPWTENLRISDAALDDEGRGFMVINRLGILSFMPSQKPILIQDSKLFHDTTAGNLVFAGDNAYFTLYKSAFFNKSLNGFTTDAQVQAEKNRSYLVRCDSSASMLFPVITYGDLGLELGEEVSGTYFDGDKWYVSIKKTSEEKTVFRYETWKAEKNLDTMSPVTREGKITLAEINEDEYRKVQLRRPFSKAPDRIKKLLKVLPQDFEYSLILHTQGGASPRQFYKGENGAILARAILTERAVCAVFPDGTTYFSGATADRQLISEGETVAFRLPKLPEDYIYTDFIISGDYLTIGWEESEFYKTGRSGILIVDLGQIFYGEKRSL